MKKIILLFVTIALLFPSKTYSQKGEAAAAAAGVLVGIGAGIAAIEMLKEQLELGAVEYALNNYPDIVDFELKTKSLGGVKMKDISSVSIVTFELENLKTNVRFIMFAFTSNGLFRGSFNIRFH